MTYTKKAQVLLTEEEYAALEETAARTGKKLGTLIREAVEKVYVEERRKAQIAESVDRLLSLPPAPVPEEYKEWEKKYSRLKGPCEVK